eukprot:332173-Chlamydomonas_euryale.AAC.1
MDVELDHHFGVVKCRRVEELIGLWDPHIKGDERRRGVILGRVPELRSSTWATVGNQRLEKPVQQQQGREPWRGMKGVRV